MIPPHRPEMESALVGSMLRSRAAVEIGLDLVTSDDFYDPELARVFAAIGRLALAGRPVDVAIVSDESGLPRQRLLEVEADAPLAMNAKHYAGFVAEDASLRRAIRFSELLAQAAYESDVEEVERLLIDPLASIVPDRMDHEDGFEAAELAARPDVEPAWVVRHLLARLEIAMWVGEPGHGKSTLLRQFGVCCASGLHPFTRVPMPAVNVVMIDGQESADDAGRELGKLLRRAGDSYRGRLWVYPKPQGIDITAPRWARWLDQRVGRHRADLVILGPLYNLVRGAAGRSKHSEETAELAAAVLGDVMVRHDCALMVEAHAPHGDEMRVRGSKLWEDWPAFGFGLVTDKDYTAGRAFDVRRFRGDRHTGRDWPARFVQGQSWPWEASNPRVPA